jgi:hypothetical protein
MLYRRAPTREAQPQKPNPYWQTPHEMTGKSNAPQELDAIPGRPELDANNVRRQELGAGKKW